MELRIGLHVELRAELQGGDPLGPPCALRTLFYYMASTLGGQRRCKAFGRAFGRAFVKLRTELRAELLQGFVRALVELCVLKCILQVDTARNFF